MTGADGVRDDSPDAAGDIVVRTVGLHGLLLELPDGVAVQALHEELLRRRSAGTLPPAEEIVPGARTLLVSGLTDRERFVAALPRRAPRSAPRNAAPCVTVPVRYDGPDLPDVAAAWGVSVAEVAAIHAAGDYRVAFCGFAPGFGYLTGLPEIRAVARRARPRTRVPAGAVGLAGVYTGVYPRPSPGGWQLIGTAVDVELWAPERQPPALLSPGTRVRFEQVTAG